MLPEWAMRPATRTRDAASDQRLAELMEPWMGYPGVSELDHNKFLVGEIVHFHCDTPNLFFFVFALSSGGSASAACMGFCVPSPSSEPLSAATNLSANYGTATSFLPLEVGSLYSASAPLTFGLTRFHWMVSWVPLLGTLREVVISELSRALQVQDVSGLAEDFFESVAFFQSSVFVTVQDNAITLRVVGGDESRSSLPTELVELQLLDGPAALLRDRYDGTPVSGSVTVNVEYATEALADLPAPTIETRGVLGRSCPSSSAEGHEGRGGRITVSMDNAVAWSGLQWDIVSAPSGIQDQFTQYLDEVNLRTVSPTRTGKMLVHYFKGMALGAICVASLSILTLSSRSRTNGSLWCSHSIPSATGSAFEVVAVGGRDACALARGSVRDQGHPHGCRRKSSHFLSGVMLMP